MNNIPQPIVDLYFVLFAIYIRIHHFFIPLFKKDTDEPMIFCIGYWKTCTTSLSEALNILGYRSGKLVKYLKRKNESWTDFIKRSNYNAFSDDPIHTLYKEIDKEFPNSRFILTERDLKSFIKSYRNYFEDHEDQKTPEELEKIYIKHVRDVKDYFKDKPDQLLVMNIPEGDGWNKLCKFLDKSVPDEPFPHKNIGRYRKKKKRKDLIK